MKKVYCNIDYRLDEKSGCPVAIINIKNIKKYLDMFKVNNTVKYSKYEWSEDGERVSKTTNTYKIKEIITWKYVYSDGNDYYTSSDLLKYLFDVEDYNKDVRIFPVRNAKMFYDVCKKLSAIVGHLVGTGLELNKKITFTITGEDDDDFDGGCDANWN